LTHGLCVGALARILNIAKPAVSQHLKILRETGLVRGEKIGYWTHYRVEKDLLLEAGRLLQEVSAIPGKDSYVCLRHNSGAINSERSVLQMCENCCQQPEKLKKKPAECTPEQIKECHGETKEHPCECATEE